VSSLGKTYTSKVCRPGFGSTQLTRNSSPFISLPKCSMGAFVAWRLPRLTLTDVSLGSFQVYIYVHPSHVYLLLDVLMDHPSEKIFSILCY
jgi:hypothetical protein